MYGSIEGVKDNLPRFADSIKPDLQATGRLDIKESTVTRYLTEFSTVIDNALYNTYRIPLKDSQGSTPEIINMIANNLASYKLANRFHSTISNEENYSFSALRKDANEMLMALVNGTYGLPGVAKVNVASGGSSGDSELDDLLAEAEDDVFFTMEDPALWQGKI